MKPEASGSGGCCSETRVVERGTTLRRKGSLSALVMVMVASAGAEGLCRNLVSRREALGLLYCLDRCGEEESVKGKGCHIPTQPALSHLVQEKPGDGVGANFQQAFFCTVHAATSSRFAGTQLWCAPGVKPGGGAVSSGDRDRKKDT